ncbi:MAG TPA: CapA family protein [Polyangiales bacterium]|nr:CapA family protein [Polyangiales bacterium]
MSASTAASLVLLLAGDVMTGRGVDQISQHPSDPELREPYVESATTYVELAARVHGPVPARVVPSYIWGDALRVLERMKPRVSIVNLETSATVSDDFWPDKAVHYRMRPENTAFLRAAHIDVCSLANNHVLDFGIKGLRETLDVLASSGLRCAGAGLDVARASMPARIPIGDDRALLVFAVGSTTSGIPREWAATPERPGVHLLADLSLASADRLADAIRAQRGPSDMALVSVHWGSNWGYEISSEQVAFAHRLIDRGVALVHGHSSHHVRALEVYRGRLILYGCGDLISDYEGIQGYEAYRGDLGVLYFASLAPDGALRGLRLVPMQTQRLQLTRAEHADAKWLKATLDRIGKPFGSSFELDSDDSLVLHWGARTKTP